VANLLAQDLDFFSTGSASQRECYKVEAARGGRRGSGTNESWEYIRKIKQVLFWFHCGALADDGEQIEICRQFAEKFAKRGDLKPEALDHWPKAV